MTSSIDSPRQAQGHESGPGSSQGPTRGFQSEAADGARDGTGDNATNVGLRFMQETSTDRTGERYIYDVLQEETVLSLNGAPGPMILGLTQLPSHWLLMEPEIS